MVTSDDGRSAAPDYVEERPVHIPFAGGELAGSLGIVRAPIGVVLIANDTGSARHRRCELQLARALRAAGAATLMVDVLAMDEQAERESAAQLRLDAMALAHRIAAGRAWLESQPGLRGLPVALVGEGGAGAAALIEAAARPDSCAAVVLRSAQPLSAGPSLDSCLQPMLLLVDARDLALVARNRAALARLQGEARLVTTPGSCTEDEEGCRSGGVAELVARWLAPRLRAAPPLAARAVAREADMKIEP